LYGKISKIVKADGSSLHYSYDAAGNRVYKLYEKADGTQDKTWYVRDAQGNVLAVYGSKSGEEQIRLKEQHLYGSSRLGILNVDKAVSDYSAGAYWLQKGNKRYELVNHLGNVLATISDKVVDSVIGGSVDHYEAEIVSAQDYYPFGMLQPDRQWRLGDYRYGFNGKENDNEVKGEGNQQDYGMRVYDPRLGRFLSVDPLTQEYPFYTPYQFAGNKPIRFIDIDGGEEGESPLFKLLVRPILKPVNDIWVAANFYDIRFKGWKQGRDETLGKVAGVLSQANTRLTLGAYVRSPESLGINEQYHDDFYAGSLAMAVIPGPVGSNGSVSPGLALASTGQTVVSEAANLKAIQRSSIVLSNASNFRSPNKGRHDGTKVRQKSVAKSENTVADQSVNFEEDAAAINAG
jgi:RHS repeat-associated protein